jgi:hypothetical protein
LRRFERTVGRRVRNVVDPRSSEEATPKRVGEKLRDVPISTGDFESTGKHARGLSMNAGIRHAEADGGK